MYKHDPTCTWLVDVIAGEKTKSSSSNIQSNCCCSPWRFVELCKTMTCNHRTQLCFQKLRFIVSEHLVCPSIEIPNVSMAVIVMKQKAAQHDSRLKTRFLPHKRQKQVHCHHANSRCAAHGTPMHIDCFKAYHWKQQTPACWGFLDIADRTLFDQSDDYP